MAIESTDEVLVNRNGVTYTQTQGEIMAKIETTDLMLVNRENVTYTVTGEEFIDSVIDPLTIDMTFGPNPPICEQDCTVTPIPVGGKAPYTIDSYQWFESEYSDGGFGVAIPGADSAVYAIPFGKEGKYFGCRVTVTDSRDSSATQTTYAQAAKVVELPPIIETVTLSETPGNVEPWNSASYDVGIEMTQGTQPLVNAIRPYVKGSLSAVIDTDVITTVEGSGDVLYSTDTIESVTNIYDQYIDDWNSMTTGVSHREDDFAKIYAFNGIVSGVGDNCALPADGTEMVFTPTVSFADAKELKIYFYQKNDPNQPALFINDRAGVFVGDNISGVYTTNITGEGLTKIRWKSNDLGERVAIYKIEVDGKPLINTEFATLNILNIDLTFPTDNNISKFQVGDVVQDNSTWNQSQKWDTTFTYNPYVGGGNGPDRLFDGSASTTFIMGAGNQTGSWSGLMTLVEPITVNSSIRFSILTMANSSTQIAINGINTNPGSYPSQTWFNATSGLTFPFQLETIRFTSNASSAESNIVYYYQIEVDGKVLVNPSIFNPDAFSITALDPAGLTITTDGGSWKGSDGSGVQGDGRYLPDQTYIANTTYTSVNGGTGGIEEVVGPNFDNYLRLWSKQNYGVDSFYMEFDPPIPGFYLDATIMQENGVTGSQGNWIINDGEYSGSFTSYNDRQTVRLVDNDVLVYKIACNSGSTPKSLPGFYIYNMFGGTAARLVDSTISGGEIGETVLIKPVSYDNVLTLASDGNLNNLAPGYAMEMSGSKTIQTSTITNVVNKSVPQPSYVFNKDPGREAVWSNLALASDNNVLTGASIPEIVANQTVVSIEATFSTPINIATVGSVAFGSYISPTYSAITTEIIVNGVSIFNGNYTAYLAAGGRVFNQGMDSYNYLLEIDAILATAGVTDINTFKYIVRGNENTNGDRGAFNGIFTRESSLEADPSLDGWYLERSDVELTFEQPNPDLKYFQPGDLLGSVSGFKPVLYTGNNSTQQITGVGFSPDLVWIKSRTAANSHALFDTVRGANDRLKSDTTAAASQSSGSLTSFDSDGFTVGNNPSVNESSASLVAWCFDAGDTTVTNNDGTIESEVRSNGYFSIIKYTGQNQQTVGHGLSATPRFLIVKCLTSDQSWPVWWPGFGGAGDQDYLMLDKNENKGGSGSINFWNSTAPTSQVFSIGNNAATAEVGQQYVAYAWTNETGKVSIEGYSGNSGVRVIDCGFKPAFVMIRCTNDSGPWVMMDPLRGTDILQANKPDIEESGPNVVFTDTGFTINTDAAYVNLSGKSYMYAAFAGPNSIEVVDVDVAANAMTVDGGDWHGSNDWNQSQEWSTTGTFSKILGTSITGDTVTNTQKAFDGDTNTKPDSGVNDTSGSYQGFYYEFATPIPNASFSKVEIFTTIGLTTAPPGDGSNMGPLVNGYDVANRVSDNTAYYAPARWVDVTAAIGADDFSGYGFWNTQTAGALGFGFPAAVRIDGKLLVDASVPAPGETQVTGDTYKGTGTVVDIDETNKQLKLSDVTSRWIEGYRAETLQEVDVAKLYAVMQENTGNIVSLTSLLPDFTDQVGQPPLQFQFPAVFPSGKTPEATFPLGTELCVDVEVTNPVGSDIELAENTGACLLPGFKKSSGITNVSEIQVSGWNQDQIWTGSVSGNQGVQGVGAVFDGDVSSISGRGQSDGAPNPNVTMVFGPNTPIIFTDKIEVWCEQGGDVPSAQWGATKVYGITNANEWVTIVSGTSGEISATQPITINTESATEYATLKGIRVDGKLLVNAGISGGNVPSNRLTFANTTNLNAFEAGDVVYMCDANGDVASYTPQTSTIANVVSNNFVDSWTATGRGSAKNPRNAFDGDLTTYTNQNTNDTTIIFDREIPFDTLKITYYNVVGEGNGAASMTVTGAAGTSQVRNTDSPGSAVAGSVRVPYTEDFSNLIISPLQSISFACAQNGANGGLYGIEVDGKLLVDGTVLTFDEPNADLKYFQPGDVVQQNGGYVTATADRVSESNTASASQEYMQSCNIAGAFGSDYNTTQGSYYSVWSGGENYVYFVFNDNEYVDESFYVRKLRALPDEQPARYLMAAYVDFMMPDGSTQSVQANLENEGPNGEGGEWFVVRKVDFPSNYVYRVSLLVPRSQNATSYYPGISFGTRGVTTEPYQLISNLVDSTDLDANTMLVDGGQWEGSDGSFAGTAWDQSESWSVNTTLTQGGITNPNDINRLFNGNIENEAGSYLQLNGTDASVTFDPPISGTSIKLWLGSSAGYTTGYLNINGQGWNTAAVPADGQPPLLVDLSSRAPITSIGYRNESNNGGQPNLRFIGLQVDGKDLVNPSITGAPTLETRVIAPAALSGTGTFDSFTSNTADLASSNLEWVADNRLGETFYMKSDQVTTFMANNPDHVAIFNAFKAAAADTYEEDVNARRSEIVGAVQRLINGETLDANEAAQVLLNVALGVNATEPFSYDGYYPLYLTPEKAIAASPLSAYHTHQFAGTDYFMPDGGTMYHGNYVSPEEVEAQHRAANETTYSSATGQTTSGTSSESGGSSSGGGGY